MRKRMIVVLPRIPWPLEKGDKLRAYYFLKGLHEQYDITLFALFDKTVSPSMTEQIRSVTDRYFFFRITLFNVILQGVVALFTGQPFQVAYYKNNRMKRAIRKACAEQKANYIVCQLIRTASYARGLTCVKILDFQDTLSLGMARRAQSSGGLQRWFFATESRRVRRYEQKVKHWFDHSFIITQQDLEALPAEGHPVHVIPNGVDTDYYAPMPCESAHDLLFVGNMGYAPNIHAMEFFVQDILPDLLQSFPGLEMVIAGANPHGRVRMLASDHVIVTGWVDDPREYYKKSKIFVAPMKIGTGLQNKLLEAMSMERPCITSSLANNALGAKPGEEIMVADTPQEWVSCITLLLNDSEFRENLAKKGREFVKRRYSWNAQINKLTQIISS